MNVRIIQIGIVLLVGLSSLIFLLFLPNRSSPIASPGEVNSDSTLAANHFFRGDSAYRAAAYDTALFYYQLAAERYRSAYSEYGKRSFQEQQIKCNERTGIIFQRLGRHADARTHLQKTLATAIEQLGRDHLLIADCYSSLGIVFIEGKKFDAGIENFQQALKIRRQLLTAGDLRVAKSYTYLAIGYTQLGDVERAAELLQRALVIYRQSGDPASLDIAKIYHSLGHAYRIAGKFDLAIAAYDSSLALKENTLPDNHPSIANTLINLGVVYNKQGQYEEAIRNFEEAAFIRRNKLGNNHPKVAQCLNNIANAYVSLGKFEQAWDYYFRTMDIKTAVYGADHINLTSTLHSIAAAYHEQQDYDKALEFHQKSLAIRVKNGPRHPLVATTYAGMSDVYASQNRFELAREYYQKAIDIRTHAWGSMHPRVGLGFQQIGELYFQQGRFTEALAFYDRALNIFTGQSSSRIHLNNDPLGELTRSAGIGPIRKIELNGQEAAVLSLLSRRIEALRAQHNISPQLNILQTALYDCQNAVTLVDEILSGFKAEEAGFRLVANSFDIYATGVNLSLKLADITADQGYKEWAFWFAEKSKSKILRKSLQEAAARKFAGIPDSLLEQERTLTIDLAHRRRTLHNALESSRLRPQKIDSLRQEYHVVKKSWNRLIAQFEESYPAYHRLKYNIADFSIAGLQQVIDDKTALIEYFWADTALHIFTLSNTEFAITSVPVKKDFRQSLETLINYVGSNKMDQLPTIKSFLALNSEIHSVLIKPVMAQLAGKEQLIIIPDIHLPRIPFGILFDASSGPGPEAGFSDFNYLIKRFAISYHYLAGALLNEAAGKPDDRQRPFLGIAPVFDVPPTGENTVLSAIDKWFSGLMGSTHQPRSTPEPLPHSETEIRQIAACFQQNGLSGDVLLRRDATKQNFIKNAGKYRYIDLATHSIVDTSNTHLSRIVFQPSLPDPADPKHHLYAGEIYGLKLNAALVVLASCESGLGKRARGEGMLAMSRGFLYAGTANILYSLWKVDDLHTARLMVEFFREVLGGAPYARALRKAQLSLINDPATAAPRFWSGFVLTAK